jgi:hypothetical protein
MYERAEVAGWEAYDLKNFGPRTHQAPSVIEDVNFGVRLSYNAIPSDVLFLIGKDWAIPVSMLFAFTIIIGACSTMWWLRHNRPRIPRDAMLMLLPLTPLVLDFFRTTRFLYADVAFLPMWALILPLTCRHKLFVVAFLSMLILYIPFFEVAFPLQILRSLLCVGLVVSLLIYLSIPGVLDQPHSSDIESAPTGFR